MSKRRHAMPMENDLNTDKVWNPATRIAFRFCFIFILLFIVIDNNGAYPFWEILMEYPTQALHQFIPWIGSHVLKLPATITVFTNGSGDTTYDYVLVLTLFITALLGTMIWSVLDRRQTQYHQLYYWLTVAIRFYVGLMLVSYGLVKVVKLQFPAPDLYRLTEPYGESSPMGLAWTFLGFSDGYNLFMGIAEMAAVFLCFRRTMTAAAILTLMTTANVTAVNYFYDVPVKIVSTALFAFTLFLLLHDLPRLLKFFFTGQPVALTVIDAPEFRKKWLRLARVVVKVLVIGTTLGFGTYQVLDSRKQYGDAAPKPKFYGLYQVETFVVGADTLPPLTTDSVRWKQLVIEFEGYAKVNLMNDSTERFTTKTDTVLQTLHFKQGTDTTAGYAFHYTLPTSDQFVLSGKGKGGIIGVVMKRKNLQKFRLMGRGFHWVNEYPYNR